MRKNRPRTSLVNMTPEEKQAHRRRINREAMHKKLDTMNDPLRSEYIASRKEYQRHYYYKRLKEKRKRASEAQTQD